MSRRGVVASVLAAPTNAMTAARSVDDALVTTRELAIRSSE